MSETLRIYNNPFSCWVDFGAGIPPENIDVTMTGTSPENPDDPDLVTIRNNLINTLQEIVNQKAMERGVPPGQFFDGQLPRLDRMEIQDGRAHIDVSRTSFFHYLAYPKHEVSRGGTFRDFTSKSWKEKTPGNQPNPIGAALAIVIESGHYIMIGTPLEQTDEQFFLKAVPSGYGDPIDKKEGVYRPEKTVTREMEEETGIRPDELQNLRLRGRAFEKSGKPATTLVFTAQATQLTREEIARREKEGKDQILFIPYTKEAIRQAALHYMMTSQGYMLGMLMTLAKDKFGDEEAHYLNDRYMRRGQIYFHRLNENHRIEIKKRQENRLSPKRIKNTVFQSETDIHPEVIEYIQTAGLDALNEALEMVLGLGEDGKLKDKINRFGEQGLRADYEAEEAVIKSLRETGLPARVISEEHGQIDLVENPTILVILDGIDGTAAYKRNDRSGTMVAIFSNTGGIIDNFTYDDCIFAGVADIKTGEITYATKGKGLHILHRDGRTDSTHASDRSTLTNEVKIYIDGGESGMAINDKVFTVPLETINFKTKPHNAGSSAVHYVDLACGIYDVVCEHTRKGNLEIAAAYRLVTEAGGFMGAIVEGKLVNLATQKFGTFGQDKNIPVIAASTQELAKAIARKLR